MTQIAAKLPAQLVSRIDALVDQGFLPSRSWAVRRGLELVLEGARRDSIDEAFRDGYGRVPETDAELREARRLAAASVAEEPWDPWW